MTPDAIALVLALLRAAEDRPTDDGPALELADFLDDHDRPVEAAELRGFVARAPRPRATPVRWAVLRNPGDDAARLVFAEVVGGEYAEFIRVQVELAWWETADARTQFAERDRVAVLRRRERELAWVPFKHFPKWPGVSFVTDQDGIDGLNDENEGSSTAVVRRGFVGELRVPTLDVLFGGPCGCSRSGGGVTRYDGLPAANCRACSGTGTTPGIAAAVWGRHPVQRVVVRDREPLRFTPDSGSASSDWPDRFAWGRQARQSGDGRHRIRDDIFALIPGTDIRSGRHKRFDTRAAALDALSAAVCARGRELVGMTAIPQPETVTTDA